MSVKQVVSTIFQAKDKISNVFKRMDRNADKFGNGAEAAFKKASKNANKFQNVTKSILKASAIQKTFSLLSQGVEDVTRSFVSFDDSLFSAVAKFTDINLKTKEGKKTFAELGKAARRVGSETQFTASQAAKGLDFLALSGQNAEQSMASLALLTDLATAGGMEDLGLAVDIATDSLGAFGLATKDSIQLQKNLTRVGDVFAKTQASSNTTIEQLFEAVGKGGPTITAAGQSIETFSSIMGILANSTLKSSEAGTQMRNIMLSLTEKSGKAGKMLKRLVGSVADDKGNFRDLVDIIGDLQRGLKGMGDVQASAALKTIFGKRSVTGMNIVLKAGVKEVRKYRESIINSTGSMKDMAEIMRQSLGNRLKSLSSAASEAGFKILEAFKIRGVNAIDAFTGAIRNLNMMPVVNALNSTLELFGSLINLTKSFTLIMSPFITAWLTYKTIILGTNLALKAYSGAIATLAVLTRGYTAVQWLLNIAMAANPVVLIIGAVVALGVALFLLFNRWTQVKNAFVVGGKAIADIFSKIWGLVKNIVSFGGGILGSALGFTVAEDKTRNAPGGGVFAPPNRDEASAQSQLFKGIFEFKNAPEGSNFSGKSTGAPLILIEGLGAN